MPAGYTLTHCYGCGREKRIPCAWIRRGSLAMCRECYESHDDPPPLDVWDALAEQDGDDPEHDK